MSLAQVDADAGVVPRSVDAARRLTFRPSRPALATAIAALGLAAAATASVSPGRDTVADGWSHSSDAATSLAWLPLLALLACSALHYVAATGALRAATAATLPFGETTAACLSAGAANKVTPAGLGGSALLARFLVRRAQVPTSEAVGTVGVVALGRAVAAALTLVLLAVAGPLIGVRGGREEVVSLAHRLAAASVLPWAAGAAGAVAVLGVTLAVRRPKASRLQGIGSPLREVLHSPRRAGALLAWSAAQSVVLGLAFAASSIVLPGPRPSASLAALVAGYLVAAAVAAAIPMPGGVGSAEAALTAVLVAAQVPLAHALVDVTIFRVLTLWAPAGVGLCCAPVLRRRGAL